MIAIRAAQEGLELDGLEAAIPHRLQIQIN